jgi:hypothetical protein
MSTHDNADRTGADQTQTHEIGKGDQAADASSGPDTGTRPEPAHIDPTSQTARDFREYATLLVQMEDTKQLGRMVSLYIRPAMGGDKETQTNEMLLYLFDDLDSISLRNRVMNYMERDYPNPDNMHPLRYQMFRPPSNYCYPPEEKDAVFEHVRAFVNSYRRNQGRAA